MHLKSLTLKGFKSFASPTTLRFEPGVTAIVGPNGSGKSNVVDAMSWVLGEQGAKALRGASMADVIFAGTPGRPALGRAEVTLTIDNTDGALPIDYAEVSITRRVFRSGDSGYEINGTACRLLDVQELLSDSGIGRELHVIVGQGQLDAVLQARPEDRRAFIEEAAGVLKHRRRKEKALRKLEAMAANLARLTDLAAELRRQLGPLGRQAEVARKASVIQANLRDSRLRLLADDLVQLRGTLEAEVRDEKALGDRLAVSEKRLAEARAAEATLDAAVAADAPRLARAQETWYHLSALEERLRAVGGLAAERARHLSEPTETGQRGRDPEALEAEAATVRAEEQRLAAALTDDRDRLAEVVTRRANAEQTLAAEEKAVVAAAKAVADRREQLARLAGQVAAARSRFEAAGETVGRAQGVVDAAQARLTAAETELVEYRAEHQLDDADPAASTIGGQFAENGQGTEGDGRHAAAAQRLAAAEEQLAGFTAEERDAERDRSAAAARRDVLLRSLTRKDASGALLAASDAGRLSGVLGPISTLLHVEPGAQVAIAAALGPAADALAVDGPEAAVAALGLLRTDDAGRAGLLVAGGKPVTRTDALPVLPAGATWAASLVRAPAGLEAVVARLLDRVAVVGTLEQALELALTGIRAVTTDGDLVGSDWAWGGSAAAPSLLEVQGAADEAAAALAEATRRGDRLRTAIGEARDERAAAKAEVDEALAALREADARAAAVAERLGRLGSAVRSATGEFERAERALREALTAAEKLEVAAAELAERLQASEAAGAETAPERGTQQRDAFAAECTAIRAEEVEARLAVRTGEERARAVTGRADALLRTAASERQLRERAERVRADRARGAVVAQAVASVASEALLACSTALAAAAVARDEVSQTRTVREGKLLSVRATVREVGAEVEGLRDAGRRDEVARLEQRLRIEALENKVAEEHGLGIEDLLAEYGPANPVPGETADDESYPFDRAQQTKRAGTAERQLALLGKVNPLALEEFDALQERSTYLTAQLEDLKTSRRDLLGIVKEVDDRIQQVFAEAFADTAREFEIVFQTLFPGGEGRLVLTEPGDMLLTGIEVEARPPGKKIKRLQLLSGGERSLTAIALLVAIFRARPSPFYVLDEVEAALDDRNLGRMLNALGDLAEKSQLLIITHQKRTMEIADALYGVTMRGDGVSAVISQRLKESA